MELLADLNASQGTTVIVVSHDQRVARATGRILTMNDGCIVDDHTVSDPLTEDLRELGRSRLGQQLLAGRVEELGSLGELLSHGGQLTPEAECLAQLLRQLGCVTRSLAVEYRQLLHL
jgi:ABC-type methionine transport system ATPase subunit